MHLKDFLRSKTPKQRRAFAKRAGTSVAYLYQLAGGHRRVSRDMAQRLSQASAGALDKMSLLWPAEAKVA